MREQSSANLFAHAVVPRPPVAPRVVAIVVALAGAIGLGALFGGAIASPGKRSYKETTTAGIYGCARCGAELFRSNDKFASTTHWPSFRAAVPGAVATRRDTSYGLDRIEALCATCGAHLGHLFPDGRLTGDTHPDAGNRYCVLSESLELCPEASAPPGH